jgi:hypothetical protein
MQKSSAQLDASIDEKWNDNTSKDISGQDFNDIAIDFTDSLVDKSYIGASLPFNITYDPTNNYTLEHNFGTQNIDVVIRDNYGYQITLADYYFLPVDNNNTTVHLFESIPPGGIIYSVLMINLDC